MQTSGRKHKITIPDSDSTLVLSFKKFTFTKLTTHREKYNK
jgi:hypothetical protein